MKAKDRSRAMMNSTNGGLLADLTLDNDDQNTIDAAPQGRKEDTKE